MQFASPVPARPTELALAVSGIEPACLQWLVDRGHLIAAAEVRKRLRAALGFSADAYRVARFLEDNYGFPADDALVALVRDGLRTARKRLPAAIKEWVVETGIRFQPVAGDPVLFHEDGVLVLGTVQTVRYETADALVAVFDDEAPDGRANLVVVTAENVARATP